MKHLIAAAGAALAAACAHAGTLTDDFFLDPATETEWARSAAPSHMSDEATVWHLTQDGYKLAEEGTNGFHCLILRGFVAKPENAAGIIAPICYDAEAAKADMQEQFLQAKLFLDGKTPAETRAAVQAAYDAGELKPVERVGFAYMMSDAQRLGPQIGAWMPHFMIYAPYANDAAFQNEFNSGLPIVFDAPGTARATFVVPLAPGEVGEHIHPGH